MKRIALILLLFIPLKAGNAVLQEDDIMIEILRDNPKFYDWDKQTREIVKNSYLNPWQL